MENKICVYAIAKNEEKFVDRWFDSVKEADYVVVLDTGSTDNTVSKLKNLGVKVETKKYDKFRFDVARNDSLKLVPDDANILVCVDIDEMFEKGWSKILKESWNDNVYRVRYRYTWNFNPDGSEGIVFMADKIHKNGCFKWTHPVHEILTPTQNIGYLTIDLPNIQLNHRADNTKSRSNYLPLLELSVQEDPSDDRNMHYLGREYMFHGEYDKAIKTLKRHLKLPRATWNEERAASMRYIADCYGYKGQHKKQEEYLLRAILEANYVREPYFQLAKFYYEQKDYLKSAVYFNEMFKITKRELNYISSPVCWSALPYDLLSLCYYYLGEYKKAIIAVNDAINLSDDPRLKSNRDFYLDKLTEVVNNQKQ